MHKYSFFTHLLVNLCSFNETNCNRDRQFKSCAIFFLGNMKFELNGFSFKNSMKCYCLFQSMAGFFFVMNLIGFICVCIVIDDFRCCKFFSSLLANHFHFQWNRVKKVNVKHNWRDAFGIFGLNRDKNKHLY